MSKWTELCDELDLELQPYNDPFGDGGWRYPSLNADKQLKVIELFSSYDFNSYSHRLTDSSPLEWVITLEDNWGTGRGKSFEEALIALIKNVYPNLLEAVQQDLIRILEA